MKEIKISMKEVAEQMVVAHQNTIIEDYQSILYFPRTLFEVNIEEFENILGQEFEKASIE